MIPSLELGGLRKTPPGEYALRFVFGGAVTAAAGIIAHVYGPSIGGLFLAFPAILPASLMLLKRHDGAREAAAARGACLGAAALAVFAATVLVLSRYHVPPGLRLGAATVVWLVTASALWWEVFGRPERN